MQHKAQASAPKASREITKYNEVATEIVTDPDISLYTYKRLRRLYTKHPDYTPDASAIKKRLTALAPLIKPKSQNKSDVMIFDEFKRLLLTHMGHIGVIHHTTDLSKSYPHITNQTHLKRLYKGLLASLNLNGRGDSFDTAYDIYTYDGEELLLQTLGGISKNRQIIRHKNADFAVHTVLYPQNNLVAKLYININTITSFNRRNDKHEPKNRTLYR